MMMSGKGGNGYDANLSLNQQVMLNQFMSITGCTYEQSLGLLDTSDWQYQVGRTRVGIRGNQMVRTLLVLSRQR